MNPLSDDINLETQKIMLKHKNGSIRVLNATEIGDLEVLDSLGGSDDEAAKPSISPPAEPQLDDPSILNMGDPSILNMGAITPQRISSIPSKSDPLVARPGIDPNVASQIASLSIGPTNNTNVNGKNKEMDRYTWQQTQGILNGHPNGSKRWRSQHSNSPRRNDSRSSRNECFQITAAEVENDFDFEASNALFDKNAVFNDITQDEDQYHDESMNERERKFQHTESVLDEYNRQYGTTKLSPDDTIWRVKNENLKLERFEGHSDKRNEAYKQATEHFTKEMAFGSIATSVTQFLKSKLSGSVRRILFLIGSGTISDLECIHLCNFISRSVPECLVYLAPSCDEKMGLKSKVSRDIKLIESFEIPSSIDLCISTLNAGPKLDFEVWKNELDFTLQSSQIKRNLLLNPTVSSERVDWVFYTIVPGPWFESVNEFYLVDCGLESSSVPGVRQVISQLF